MFKGSIVALITPFKNDRLDEENYSRLIHHHISSGTNGIVPAGTTGESPTLSHDEHRKVIEIAVNECRGKIPVIAGTGSNSTAEAIELSKHAEKSGANGLLIVTPYYNKPTQEGLYQHFKAINDNCSIPIIIYNIPPRSVVDRGKDDGRHPSWPRRPVSRCESAQPARSEVKRTLAYLATQRANPSIPVPRAATRGQPSFGPRA